MDEQELKPYVHQDYPRLLYRMGADRKTLEMKTVGDGKDPLADARDLEAAQGDGWKLTKAEALDPRRKPALTPDK